MWTSRADLIKQLRAAKAELDQAINSWKSHPKVIQARADLAAAEQEAKSEIREKILAAHAKVSELNASLEQMLKAVVVPEDVKQYFADYTYGTTTNADKLRLRWRSADKRFIIWTVPGTLYWSARGEQSYGKTQHRLTDLNKYVPGPSGNIGYRQQGILFECEGILTKDRLEFMKQLAEEERKKDGVQHNTLDSK